jgi:hypothetical protein
MIAYLVLVHRYPEQFKRLFRAIHDPANVYLVHLDKNSGPALEGDIRAFLAAYLRKLLVVGATSVIRRAKAGGLAAAPWIRSLLERRPARVVTVAMANTTARIVWAVLARGEDYRPAAMA